MTSRYELQLDKVRSGDELLRLADRVKRDRRLTLLERAELLGRIEERARYLILERGRR